MKKKKKNLDIKPTFVVSTNGDDTWSGRFSEPNAQYSDGPFATLTRARDAVRELSSQGKPCEPITIMVRGGHYYLSETLELTKEDSGSPQSPISYRAYPGEQPVLSGGRRLTDWQPHKDKILKCPIADASGRR